MLTLIRSHVTLTELPNGLIVANISIPHAVTGVEDVVELEGHGDFLMRLYYRL
jgi:hypothetical protein